MSQITSATLSSPFADTPIPDVSADVAPGPLSAFASASRAVQFSVSFVVAAVLGASVIAGVGAVDPVNRFAADDSVGTIEIYGPAPNHAHAAAYLAALDADDADDADVEGAAIVDGNASAD